MRSTASVEIRADDQPFAFDRGTLGQRGFGAHQQFGSLTNWRVPATSRRRARRRRCR